MLKDTVIEIRKDFPYLNIKNGNGGIIYLDNAATKQKPNSVIKALKEYYEKHNGNPHRGAHYLSMEATNIYEKAREYIAEFINARVSEEIVFLRNTTEAINLLAYSYGMEEIDEGDEILISIMEHHSNLIPWQEIARIKNAKLKYIYLNDDMQIDWNEFVSKVNARTKIFSITAASNVIGTIPNIKEMAKYIRTINSKTKIIIDGAQFIADGKTDVQDLDCDFLAFSGHKILSPTGIGVLYGKKELLNNMKPFNYGGDMIEYVFEQESSFLASPFRFEAGTQNVAGACALKTAIEYMQSIGIEEISEYEKQLTKYCYERMKDLNYLEIYATSNENRSPLISFNFKEIHPHDVASILDTKGIAIRSGHHCAQPLHRYLGIGFSCRASFAFYNTFEEIDYFIDNLEYVKQVMKIES